MSTVPKCPACGSKDMIVGGFVSFRWRRGRLVPERYTQEVADGAPWHCQSCSQAWAGNHEPPFNFAPDKTKNPEYQEAS